MSCEEAKLGNCLICWKGLEELKPLLDSENVIKFKRAFRTFCGLLNVGVGSGVDAIIDGAISVLEGSEEVLAFGVACCGECSGALGEIDRLQRAIDEMKAVQMDHVSGLKTLVLSPGDENSYGLEKENALAQTRKLLIDCISKDPLLSERKAELQNPTFFDDDAVVASLSCPSPSSPPPPNPVVIEKRPRKFTPRILQKRWREDHHSGNGSTKLKQNKFTIATSGITGLEEAAQLLPTCYVSLERLSSSATLQTSSSGGQPEVGVVSFADVDKDATRPRRSATRGSAPILKNKVISDDEDDDLSDNGDHFEPRHEDASEDDDDVIRVRPTKSKPPKVHHLKGRKKLTSYFYRITDTNLLYKFTLIEVTLCGTQLKCLETNCSAFFQDTDYVAIFKKMRAHIEQDHLPNGEKGDSSVHKTCPFPDCNQEFQEDDPFRLHLLVHHKVTHIVCEICWKPQRIFTWDMMSRHWWSHKNEQEKLEVPPPNTVLYYSKRCKTEKGRSRWLELDKAGPPQVHSNNWKIPKNEYFSKLSDELLLYKYTVVRVIPGGRLSCLEPECSAFTSEGIDYDAFEELKTHVKDVHLIEEEGNVYTKRDRKCPLCPEMEFTGGYLMRAHLLSKDHGHPPYVCTSCWKPFKQMVQLRVHISTHQPPKEDGVEGEVAEQQVSKVKVRRKYVCGVCGKEFLLRQLQGLRRHERTHLPKDQRRVFGCDQCPKRFCDPFTLKQHVESVHLPPDLKRLRSCPICSRQFLWSEKKKFEVHMSSHSNEKPFVCDQCGKAFAAQANLRGHQRTMHPTGEGSGRRYQCEFCEMDYKSNRNLREHQLRAHKDKVTYRKDPTISLLLQPPEYRPDFIGPRIAFPCEICDKVFRLKCRLRQHMKKYH